MMRATSLLLLTMGLMTVCPVSGQAGWPFSDEGPRRGSDEYYEMHSGSPIGQRQRYKFGKTWPTRPRPVGPSLPLIHLYHHNQNWPHPYDYADRASVEQFRQIQIGNGWEQATTFYDYHFDRETQQLNSAGREHLYFLLSKVPVQFRTAHVQASLTDPSLTSARVATLEEELAVVLGENDVPPILPRVTAPIGTPASEVNAVFQYRQTTLSPAPTLSSSPGGSSSGP